MQSHKIYSFDAIQTYSCEETPDLGVQFLTRIVCNEIYPLLTYFT